MKKIKLWIKEIYLVYCKEFKLVMHDAGLIIFFAFLPLAYPVIYALIYGPELVRDVPMVVVDNDRSEKSRELVRNLDACQEVLFGGYATDMPEARKAMADGKCFAILEIPKGFEKKLGRNEQGKAVMFCEMSLLLRYRGFLVASTNVMQKMSSELQINDINELAPLTTTLTTGDPMPIESISLGNPQSGFDSFIMPGIVVLILHQAIILAMGMAGGAKREKTGLLGYNPINAMPSYSATMIGQMLTCVTIIFIPMIFLVHYVPLIFGFPMIGNLWQELLFLLPMVLACVALGISLQGLIWEREAVFVIWVITSVAFLFLSGLTWPRYAMSPFWKVISGMIPATWGIEGFVRMNSNGASLSQVAYEYYALWILCGVYCVIGYCVQRWIVRPSIRHRINHYLQHEVEIGQLPATAVPAEALTDSLPPEEDPIKKK